jgi:putative transposase
MQKPESEPQLVSRWPLPRLPKWVARVNEPLTKNELKAVRLSANRGRPLGDEGWVEPTARRLNLECTMRPRGRPRVRPNTPKQNKEACPFWMF